MVSIAVLIGRLGKVLAAKNATDKDFKVKPIDDLDAACRIHDKEIRDKGNSFKVDTKLMRKAEKIAQITKVFTQTSSKGSVHRRLNVKNQVLSRALNGEEEPS